MADLVAAVTDGNQQPLAAATDGSQRTNASPADQVQGRPAEVSVRTLKH
jgi:hypothetical protein